MVRDSVSREPVPDSEGVGVGDAVLLREKLELALADSVAVKVKDGVSEYRSVWLRADGVRERV